jgi:hypothetical protein
VPLPLVTPASPSRGALRLCPWETCLSGTSSTTTATGRKAAFARQTLPDTRVHPSTFLEPSRITSPSPYDPKVTGLAAVPLSPLPRSIPSR